MRVFFLQKMKDYTHLFFFLLPDTDQTHRQDFDDNFKESVISIKLTPSASLYEFPLKRILTMKKKETPMITTVTVN